MEHKIIWRLEQATKKGTSRGYLSRMILVDDIRMEMIMEGTAMAPPLRRVLTESHIPCVSHSAFW